MLNIKLEAPWYTWRKKAAALFEGDPDIIVGEVYEIDSDDVQYGVDFEIRNTEKYKALDRVLPSVKEFGNVKLAITLFDEENSAVNPDAALYETIFKGNPIFDRIEDTVDYTGTHIAYCVLKPVITQFFDDNLADYHGNWSGLAQDIAEDVFDNDFRGVYFCTADFKEAAKADSAKSDADKGKGTAKALG